MLFDSHCHLDDPRLRDLPSLMVRAARAGIAGFLVPGVAPEGWPGILALPRNYPQVLPSFGVHPMHAHLLDAAALDELAALSPFAAAVGEIGLDYSPTFPPKEVQQQAFLAQLRLAFSHRLPVLIHCRNAFGDLLELLRLSGGAPGGGVMHAFSGSVEVARECLKLGLHISLCGTITYRGAVKPLRVAQEIPLERLLLETDAPDLAPEPYRGDLNLPEHLVLIARRLAEVKGLTVEEVAEVTGGNARRLFRVSR